MIIFGIIIKILSNGKQNSNLGHYANKGKIWKLEEMNVENVMAWNNGGATDISNCQMLCKHHYRSKGNK